MSAGGKYARVSEQEAGPSDPLSKKRATTAKTVDKRKKEHDREQDTATWLRYEMTDRDHVLNLSCCICMCTVSRKT